MTRVRQVTLEAGPGGVVPPGRLRDVAGDEEKQLIAGGHAVQVDGPAGAGGGERTVKTGDETAARRNGGPARGRG